jgi:hypothetical protein
MPDDDERPPLKLDALGEELRAQHGQLGADTLASYDEVVHCFGDPAEPARRERAARALVYKAVVLGLLDRDTEELAGYDEVVSRFGYASESGLGNGRPRHSTSKPRGCGPLVAMPMRWLPAMRWCRVLATPPQRCFASWLAKRS